MSGAFSGDRGFVGRGLRLEGGLHVRFRHAQNFDIFFNQRSTTLLPPAKRELRRIEVSDLRRNRSAGDRIGQFTRDLGSDLGGGAVARQHLVEFLLQVVSAGAGLGVVFDDRQHDVGATTIALDQGEALQEVANDREEFLAELRRLGGRHLHEFFLTRLVGRAQIVARVEVGFEVGGRDGTELAVSGPVVWRRPAGTVDKQVFVDRPSAAVVGRVEVQRTAAEVPGVIFQHTLWQGVVDEVLHLGGQDARDERVLDRSADGGAEKAKGENEDGQVSEGFHY